MLSRVELLYVKLWAVRVCVNHFLSSCFVTTEKVLDSVDWVVLKKRFYPSTTPAKESVYWTLAMLFPKEVQSHLGLGKFVVQCWAERIGLIYILPLLKGERRGNAVA